MLHDVKYTGIRKFYPTISQKGTEDDRYSTTLSLTSDLDGGTGGQGYAAAILRPGKRRGSFAKIDYKDTIIPNSNRLTF